MKKFLKEIKKIDQSVSEQIPDSVKAIFVIVILSLIITGHYWGSKMEVQEAKIRKNVIETISNIQTNASVIVDGIIVNHSQAIIKDLMTMDNHRGHHSHPEMRIRITITNLSQSITLDLGRDSEIPTEYWIFNPSNSYLDRSYIGSYRTETLSDWKGVKIKTPREIERYEKKGIQPDPRPYLDNARFEGRV